MLNGMQGRKAGEVICEKLMEKAGQESELVILTSDSRGSGALLPFAEKYPEKMIEVGIAEQNLVSIAAGLAHEGKKSFVFSPAAFLTMRSIEQVKVDVAYSNTNVKLIGISGGNSYSDLGSSHHSLQDLAVTRAIPNLEVFMPCDQYQVKQLFEYLLESEKPAFVRIGKMTLPDCYSKDDCSFVPGKANVICHGSKIAIIASGETVHIALEAHERLLRDGLSVTVVDMHTIKPLDKKLLIELTNEYEYILSVEEHSIHGGLGAAVAEVIAAEGNTKLKIIGFPDEAVICGSQLEVLRHYGIAAETLDDYIKNWIR